MPLRIGFIGTGGMGQHHIENIRSVIPGAQVTAVNDADESVARAVAQSCGARYIPDPYDLIRSDEVDAVMIASWDPTHEGFSVAAIEEGKYVFCEKPLSDTPEGCLRIMEAEQKAGKRLLQVGFMRRFDADYRELREVIARGDIGIPLVVHAQHRNLAPAGGAKITSDMSATNALVHEFDITRFLIGDDDTHISAQLVAPRWRSSGTAGTATTSAVRSSVISEQPVYRRRRTQSSAATDYAHPKSSRRGRSASAAPMSPSCANGSPPCRKVSSPVRRHGTAMSRARSPRRAANPA